MWPDVSELASDERCPTPLTLPDGRAAEVFSAYNRPTVDRQFRWMQEYELPGVFLQRFTVIVCDNRRCSGFATASHATCARPRSRTAACSRSCTTSPDTRARSVVEAVEARLGVRG